MVKGEIIYKDFVLAVIEQRGAAGGYKIAIAPLAGEGTSVLTMTYRELADAITEARVIVDNGVIR